MPGGGSFLSLQEVGVSSANERGQHALLAVLKDGTTAAYRLDADGRLSLILQSGATTSLGPITNVGQGAILSRGIGLNRQGQVAVTVRVADRTDTVVLLTPRSP